MLEVGSALQVPTFRNSPYLDPQVGLTRNLGVRQRLTQILKKGRTMDNNSHSKQARVLSNLHQCSVCDPSK